MPAMEVSLPKPCGYGSDLVSPTELDRVLTAVHGNRSNT